MVEAIKDIKKRQKYAGDGGDDYEDEDEQIMD
jgi:hypothetical protein